MADVRNIERIVTQTVTSYQYLLRWQAVYNWLVKKLDRSQRKTWLFIGRISYTQRPLFRLTVERYGQALRLIYTHQVEQAFRETESVIIIPPEDHLAELLLLSTGSYELESLNCARNSATIRTICEQLERLRIPGINSGQTRNVVCRMLMVRLEAFLCISEFGCSPNWSPEASIVGAFHLRSTEED